MARATAASKTAASEPAWTTVADESPTLLIMDTPGDQFTGEYLGVDHIVPREGDPFDRLLFRGSDGVLYTMNRSFKLGQAFDDIDTGSQVRITLVKEIDLGKEDQNPMKDYRVEVAR